jgi:anti-repressor protein
MNELIKITEKDGKKAVSARLLFAFLGIQTDFTTWCKRMFEYGFIENTDYAFLKFGEPENQLFGNPNPKVDYVLSLDCAKEISMLQRSEKGKEARKYFIECEKQLLKPKEISRKELAQMVIDLENEKEALAIESHKKTELIEELAPKASVYDKISDCTNLKSMGEVAKVLGFGRNTLFEILRQRKVLMRNNLPYQSFIDSGYFEVKTTPIPGIDKNNSQTFATSKGELWMAKLLNIPIVVVEK